VIEIDKMEVTSRIPYLVAAIVVSVALHLYGANGTPYYFDVNNTTAGFGSPSGSYNQNGAYWSTSSTGTVATAALPADVQLTFGNTGADFAGTTFTIVMNSNTWDGLLVNSASANITMNGTANSFLNASQTWTVASGSTLNEGLTWSDGALNFNSELLTLAGGGTINFTTMCGYNSNNVITENGSGLVVNLNAAAVGTQGTEEQASYTLTQGTLNFHVSTAFNRMRSADAATFTISGGTINNTSGSAMTLDMYQGTYAIGNSFTFTGTNSLDFGTQAVALTTANPTITVTNNTLTISGVISGGTNGITKAGNGTLVLNGTNTYTGTTVISAGKLSIGNGGTTGSISSSSNITDNSVLLFNRSTPYTYSGIISGSGAVLDSGASGGFTLSGANTYSGGTTIYTNDTVFATNSTALGTGPVALTAGTDGHFTALSLGNGVTMTNALTLNSNSIGNLRAYLIVPLGAAATWNGAITLAGDTSIGLWANGTLTVGGAIGNGSFTGMFQLRGGPSGVGTLGAAATVSIGSASFCKTDTATWTISSTGNTWGKTAISSGILKLGVSNAFPSATVVTMGQTGAYNAMWDLNGYSQTITGLTEVSGITGTYCIVTNSGSAATLTINNSSDYTYDSLISGPISLTKSGSGTQTLAKANTYTGTTTINGGTLFVTNVSGSGTGTGAVSVGNGGTFGGTGEATGAVTVNSGATLSPGTTGPGQLQIKGNLLMNSGSTYHVVLDGFSSGQYSQVFDTGTINLGSATLSLTLGFAPTPGQTFTIIDNDGADAVTGTFNGLAQGTTISVMYSSTSYYFTVSYVGGTGNDIVLTSVAITGKHWTGTAGNGNWNTASNWSGSVVPSTTDTVIFDNTSTANCTLTTVNTSIKSIVFSNNYTGMFNFNGKGLTLSGGADFRSGGSFAKQGTDSIYISGTGPLTFFPKTGGIKFPKITIGASGTTTVKQGVLSSTKVIVFGGTLVMDTSFSVDTVSVITVGSTFDFGTKPAANDTIVTLSGNGVINFDQPVVCAKGDLNLQSFTSVIPGNSEIKFVGATPQNFYPDPVIIHAAIGQYGAGGTTVQSNSFFATMLDLNSGMLHLGTGLIDSIGNMSVVSGGLDMGNSTLKTAATTMNFAGLSSFIDTGASTLEFAGNSGQQTLTPKPGVGFALVKQTGTGGTKITGAPFLAKRLMVNAATVLFDTMARVDTISLTTSGTLDFGTKYLGFSDTVTTITGSGTLNFDSPIICVKGDLSLSAFTSVMQSGPGEIKFISATTQNFTPYPNALLTAIGLYGGGTTTVLSNGIKTSMLDMFLGTLSFGSTLTDSIGNLNVVSGSINMGSSIFKVGGTNIDFSNITSLTPGTGILDFTGNSGQQTFTPKAGVSFPLVRQMGTGGTKIKGKPFSAQKLMVNASAVVFDTVARVDTIQVNAGATMDFGTKYMFPGDTVTNINGAGNLYLNQPTIYVKGDLNLSTFSTVTQSATGIIKFMGATVQNFTPKAGVNLASISQNSPSTTNVLTNGFKVNYLDLSAGTLNLGAGLVDSAGDISNTAGNLNLGTSTLKLSGTNLNFNNLPSLTASPGSVVEFTGNSGQQTFTPKVGVPLYIVNQTGLGGTKITGNPFYAQKLLVSSSTMVFDTSAKVDTIQVAPGATMDFGTRWGPGLSDTVASLQGSGSVNLHEPVVCIKGDLNLSTFSSVMQTANGQLKLVGPGAQNFTPRPNSVMAAISQYGAGGSTILTNGLKASALSLYSGQLNLGSGLIDSIGAFSAVSGSLNMGSSTLKIGGTGAIDFNNLSIFTPGTGTLEFTGTGTQSFTPRNATSHPAITHTGSGTFQLSTYPLSCASLNNSNGSLDFNGQNITTAANGNFTITNGTSSTISNLDGRTITTSGTGNISFTGQSGSYLNLNPNTGWNVNAGGSLTATYATIKNSNASGSSGWGLPTNCTDATGNAHWDFSPPVSAITNPAPGFVSSLASISGTSSDAGSGVASVKISIFCQTDGKYWNGGAWVVSDPGWVLNATGTTSWSFTPPAWTSGNTYVLKSRATDNIGNIETPGSGVTFAFDATPPTSFITSPTAGASVNSLATIAGTANDGSGSGVTTVQLSMYNQTDASYWDGGSWTATVTWLAASGTASWSFSPPALTGGKTYVIKSKATDAAGNVETPGSGNTFIYDNSAPVVSSGTLTSPNGGEVLGGGSTHLITWNNASITDALLKNNPIALWYSTDGGATFPNSIAGNLINTGTYSWTLPSVNSSTVRVRLEVQDSAGNLSADTSNANFLIDNSAPTISSNTFTAPNGGEVWAGGSGHSITWDNASFSDALLKNNPIALWYSTDGGVTFPNSIASNLPNSGTYSWTVPPINSSAVLVRIDVQDSVGNVSSDASNANFIIDNSPPTISSNTLTAPNGGEVFAGGSSHSITWNNASITDALLKNNPIALWYSTDGGVTFSNSIASNLPNTGAFLWTVPAINSATVRVRILVQDSVGNISADTSNGNFAIDNAPPASSIAVPAYGGKLTALPSITGTATDGQTSVSQVQVSIQKVSGGQYWTGSAWGSLTWLPASGTSSWSYNATGIGFTPGSYTVQSKATDAAGNSETPATGNSFILDNSPPVSSVSTPANNGCLSNLSSIMGSATDAGCGVCSVMVAIYCQTDNQYYDGSAWAGASAVWRKAFNATSWWIPSAPWTNGKTYVITPKAIDSAGNVEMPGIGSSFVFDQAAPISAIASPSGTFADSASPLSGTANDGAGCGISSVKLSIHNQTDNTYYNGSTWNVTDPGYVCATTGTSAWTYAALQWAGGKTYVIKSQATDLAGNTETPGAGKTFSIDNSPPVSSITLPAQAAVAQSLSSISGTASDAVSGVSQVQITVGRVSDSKYWTGSVWGGITWLSATGTSSWTFNASGVSFTSGVYTVQSRATDAAGNVEAPGTGTTFTYDNSPPWVMITFPDNRGRINAASSFAGTATDSGTGTSQVNVTLFDSTAGQYYTGSSWSPTYPGWVLSATGTTSWNYAAPTLTNSHMYLFKVRAADIAGNISAVSASLFTFDNVMPTVSINQAAGQSDPCTSLPIHFTAVFSEPVTGLTTSRVVLSGTAVGAKVTGVTQVTPFDGTVFDITCDSLKSSGTIVAVIAASAVVDLAGNPCAASASTDDTVTFGFKPRLSIVRADTMRIAGDTAVFRVSAAGTRPLTYQWQKNGTAIAGATDSSYATGPVSTLDSGTQYRCIAANAYGSDTGRQVLLCVVTKAKILVQPHDTVVISGNRAVFSVGGSGTPPLLYQWQKNGTALAGVVSPACSTAVLTQADTGEWYRCIVTNAYGNDTSWQAKLTVLTRARITRQPHDTAVIAGAPASFSVSAQGSVPLKFKWIRNKADSVGADSVLMLSGVKAMDGGAVFQCIVSNIAGVDTSVAAMLRAYVTPHALYVATPVSGAAPLQVNFTDSSTGTITSWRWNFGDGSTDSAKSPGHRYSGPGAFTVKLMISGPAGTDSCVKLSYISVADTTPPLPVIALKLSASGPGMTVAGWTPSASSDAESVAVCASVKSPVQGRNLGVFGTMMSAVRTSDTLVHLPADGSRLYVSVYVKDSSGNWSAPSQDSVMLNDTVPPANRITVRPTSMGDSAIGVTIVTDSTVKDAVNLEFGYAYAGAASIPALFTAGYKDTSFTIRNIRHPGVWRMSIKALDAAGNKSQAIIDSVVIVNLPPRFVHVSDSASIKQDTTWIDSVVAHDPDSEAVHYSVASLPTGMIFDTVRGVVSWKPDYRCLGNYQVVVRAADASGASAPDTIRLTVLATPPVVVMRKDQTKVLGAAARFVLGTQNATDTGVTYDVSVRALDDTTYLKKLSCTNGIVDLYPLADGKYRLTAVATDRAGRRDTLGVKDTFEIKGATTRQFAKSGDTTAPSWQMVSLPSRTMLVPSSSPLSSLFHWDEQAGERDIYGYYHRVSETGQIVPGSGYWRRATDTGTIVIPRSNVLDSVVTIVLYKGALGWNQIASPFPYPVAWPYPGILWQWNDSTHDFQEANGVLNPWQGYWVMADSTMSIRIENKPVFVPPVMAKRNVAKFADKSNWQVRVNLSTGTGIDAENILGFSAGAKNGYDANDAAKPPRMADYQYMFFSHPEWKRGCTEYARDIRRALTGVEAFTIGITPGKGKQPAMISCDGLTKVADSVGFYLADEKGVTAVEAGKSYPVAASSNVVYKTLFVTTDKNFLKNYPRAFSLGLPYPNPTRRMAHIQYSLPYHFAQAGIVATDPYKVSVALYDIMGRQVRQLVYSMKAPGNYTVAWDGKNNAGLYAATGMYFCRIEANEFNSVKKITVIR